MAVLATIETTIWHRIWSKWLAFCAVYRTLNRKGELERLVQWASRKKLAGPKNAYERKIVEEERRLIRHASQSPRLVRWAHLLRWLSLAIRTTPKYAVRGSASAYRSDYSYRGSYSYHRGRKGQVQRRRMSF
jgi:hypothetical protein